MDSLISFFSVPERLVFLVLAIFLIVLIVVVLVLRRRLREVQGEVAHARRRRRESDSEAESVRQRWAAIDEEVRELRKLVDDKEALRAETENLRVQADALRKQVADSEDMLDAMQGEKEKMEQANAADRLLGVQDQVHPACLSSFEQLGISYGYRPEGVALETARKALQSLYLSGDGVRSTTDEPLAPGLAACLLDSVNNLANHMIERAEKGRESYDAVVQRVKDAVFIQNTRARYALHAEITEQYLNAVLDVICRADAVLRLKREEWLEQKRIREAIKEQNAQREQAEVERERLEKAIAKAKAQWEKTKDEEIRRTIEALEEKYKNYYYRSTSQAELTRRGTVYVLSNIGSFGENVYKIGMTRRNDPQIRVDELSTASVPFPFDVHAYIFTEDAPELETQLHRTFEQYRINKTAATNQREFYRVHLKDIREECERRGYNVHWTMKAEAAEYFESLQMSVSAQEYKRIRSSYAGQDEHPLDAAAVPTSQGNLTHRSKREDEKLAQATSLVRIASLHDVLCELQKSGMKYVNNLDANGALWVEKSEQSAEFVKGLRINGREFRLAGNSRALGGMPGYYIRPPM